MRNPRILRIKTLSPNTADSRWWELQTTPPDLGQVGSAASKVLLGFQQVNGSAVVAHDGASSVADVRVLLYALNNAGIAVLMGAEELTGHILAEGIVTEIPPGWSFAVWMSAITSPTGTATGVRVWWDNYRA